MTVAKKLEEIALDVAEIKGSLNVLANSHQHTAAEIKKVEGRQWGLVVAVLLTFLSSILALALAKPVSSRLSAAIHAAFQFFSF